MPVPARPNQQPPSRDEDDVPPLPTDIQSMEDVCKQVSAVKYLVPKWIPLGMVTMVMAEPGVGKSAFALGLVASVTDKRRWFSGDKGPEKAGRVVWIDTEGAAGINAHRVKAWKLTKDRIVVPARKADALSTFSMEDDADVQTLVSHVKRLGVRLVVVDSLRGSHGRDENSSASGDVVKRLALLAQETGCAVVLIHHTKKLFAGQAITANDSRGSNAFQAMVRSQIGLDKPDPGSAWVRVQMLKENLGLKPDAVGFLVTDDGIQYGKPPQKPRRDVKLKEAEDWLADFMAPAGTWKPSSEIEKAGGKRMYGVSILQRAKEALGVVGANVRKVGDRWECRLPPKK